MSMITGIRLVNSILAGTLSSAQLETALATAINRSGWRLVVADKTYAGKLVTSAAGMEVVVRSATARSDLTVNTAMYKLIAQDKTAIGKLIGAAAGSATVFADSDALVADATAMALVAASAAAIAFLGNSTVAAASLGGSTVGSTAFASSIPLTNLAAYPTAMAVLSTYAAPTLAFNTSTLRKIIGKSASFSVWYKNMLPATSGTLTSAGTVNAMATDGLGNLVAATQGGLYRSTNGGATWTNAGAGTSPVFSSVIWVPFINLFVAFQDGGPYQNARIHTSPTGASWTARTTPGTGGANHYGTATSLTYGNGRIVCVGTQGTNPWMAQSTDGINWTQVGLFSVPSGTAVGLGGVDFGNGKFVAVTRDGVVSFSSVDGVAWVGQSNRAPTANIKGVKFFQGVNLFIAVSSDAVPISVSADGSTWAKRTVSSTGTDSPSGSTTGGITTYNGLLLWAVNSDLWASTDAATFTKIAASNTANAITGVAVLDGSIFAGSSAQVNYS